MKRLLFLTLLLGALQPASALPEADIQRFIDEAIKAGGGEVVIPPGVHVIQRGLMLKDAKKLRIIGLDAEASVLKAAPNAVSLFLLGGACEEVRIEKLTFEGGQDAVAEMAEPGQTNKLAKVRVGRCFFQNQRRAAVLLPKAAIEALEIEDCTFRDIAGAAIVFGEQMSGCSITHNHVTRCQTGVQLTGSQRCLVASNEISACDTGVLITGATEVKTIAQGNVVALNAITGSLKNAVQINSRTQKNSVIQNEITGSGMNGILLAGEGQIVKANQITSSGMKAIAISEGKHEIVE
ncbi:MAG: NosD domain-containing protein [Prosthecobacter sp.]|uniref:NosD domain-containing protein n=1 Tax=Prosthecobacter sp. TaxID=1965333 RepID=UPI0038FEEFF0